MTDKEKRQICKAIADCWNAFLRQLKYLDQIHKFTEQELNKINETWQLYVGCEGVTFLYTYMTFDLFLFGGEVHDHAVLSWAKYLDANYRAYMDRGTWRGYPKFIDDLMDVSSWEEAKMILTLHGMIKV